MLGVNFAIPLSCEQSLCVHLLLTFLPLYALLIFLASFSCFVSFLDVGFQSYFLLWGHLCVSLWCCRMLLFLLPSGQVSEQLVGAQQFVASRRLGCLKEF